MTSVRLPRDSIKYGSITAFKKYKPQEKFNPSFTCLEIIMHCYHRRLLDLNPLTFEYLESHTLSLWL